MSNDKKTTNKNKTFTRDDHANEFPGAEGFGDFMRDLPPMPGMGRTGGSDPLASLLGDMLAGGEKREQAKAERTDEARAKSLDDFKTEFGVRSKRAEECAGSASLRKQVAMLGVLEDKDREDDWKEKLAKSTEDLRREDRHQFEHGFASMVAEIGIQLNRRLREQNESLDRIAVALENANYTKGDN